MRLCLFNKKPTWLQLLVWLCTEVNSSVLLKTSLRSFVEPQLRRAVSAAMFKGFTWCRSPVLAVSLILPGQRVDAKQAYMYHVLSLCRRIFTKRPALRALFEVAWTFVVPRQCKTIGLVVRIFQITKLLDYQWIEPWVMVSQNQEEFVFLGGAPWWS